MTIGFGITHYLEKNEAQSPPSPSPSIDWPLVAKHLQERPVSSAPLINQIQSLPADELTQSLAEISESHLAPKSQRLLTTHLTRPLLKASPSHLLTHPASTPITNNIWEVEQGKAMFAWVGESPKAAISWFDPLASVSFTGPPRTRLNFEIINALTLRASVPDSDRLRFADRDRFGEGWFKNYSELAITEPVEKYAILVRLLPPGNQEPIAAPLIELGEAECPPAFRAALCDLDGISEMRPGKLPLKMFKGYLQRIKPNAEELQACISAVTQGSFLDLPKTPNQNTATFRTWLEYEVIVGIDFDWEAIAAEIQTKPRGVETSKPSLKSEKALQALTETQLRSVLKMTQDAGLKYAERNSLNYQVQKTTNPTNQPTSSRTSKRTPSSDRLAIIDWSQVANDLKDRSRHVDKFKPSPALEQQLKQLSKSDLLAALDATLKGDLDAQDKVNLTRYLTTLLIHVRRMLISTL